ncbi:MAG: helix-turn-helix domain-containing protein, partial [Thermodesulfobacteriota bacterium]|nr:helix-turn-helix domain-containing protein [Thermodesulfobacteriota bacterium]
KICSLEEMEKNHIERALMTTKWHRSKTAELLDIDRKTLYQKIKKYGLDSKPKSNNSPLG